jgi:hypothetical protein
MIYLALSCLQGRSLQSAATELSALGDGVQFTPGNEPSAHFVLPATAKTHHGFSLRARSQQVWSDEGMCLVTSDSVHPPKLDSNAGARYDQWYDNSASRSALETMYPGYCLGTGDALERAMERCWPLAVDISHLFIQRAANVISVAQLNRVFSYGHITEIHVSANNGSHDSHQLICENTFGLRWAQERAGTGIPLVFEAYLHTVSSDNRKRQIDLIRGPLGV